MTTPPAPFPRPTAAEAADVIPGALEDAARYRTSLARIARRALSARLGRETDLMAVARYRAVFDAFADGRLAVVGGMPGAVTLGADLAAIARAAVADAIDWQRAQADGYPADPEAPLAVTRYRQLARVLEAAGR